MISLSKFEWKTFFWKFYDKIFDSDIFSLAAQVAFYFSFSLFPLLFFLVSLFGLLLESTENLKIELFEYLRQIMPYSAFTLVQKTVDEIVVNSSSSKLTIGLLITLWSASAGVDSTRGALNSVYGLRETRPWWKTKLQSLALTLLTILIISIMLITVFYGWQLFQMLLSYLGITITSPLVLVSVQWATILIMLLISCEMIFNLLPDFKKKTWHWITPGSFVSILLWLVLSSAFSTYLQYFNTYNRTYGSLGAVIILMLWLYLAALAIMVGGVINAVLSEMRSSDVSEINADDEDF